MDRLIAQR